MYTCLICKTDFKSARSLGAHVSKLHGISIREYKQKFDLIKKCKTCGIELSRKANGEYCTRHRDRTGKNNPFYGKSHTSETKNIIQEKCRVASELKWEDKEYRDRVIAGATGLKRSDEFKHNQRLRALEWYSSNPAQKELRSINMKKSWSEGKIEPNINSINESKTEKELRGILESILGNVVQKRTLHIGDKWYYPDIILGGKFIVEYYGNFWHANPRIYNETDMVHHNRQAIDIWDHDNSRKEILENNGYYYYIIWEDDYKNDQDNCIKNVLSEFEQWKKQKLVDLNMNRE